MGFGGLNRRGNLRPQTRGRLQGGSFIRPKGATPGSMYVSKSGHSVHMRGLPFQAIEQDIRDVSIFSDWFCFIHAFCVCTCNNRLFLTAVFQAFRSDQDRI